VVPQNSVDLLGKLLFDKLLHVPDLVLVDGHCHGLELQRQVSFHQQANASHAAVKGTGNAGQLFVGLPGTPVKRNLDGKGTKPGQIVGDLGGNESPIGEQSDEQPFLFCIGVDVQKILAGKDLAAGEEKPETAGFGDLIQNPAVFLVTQLPGPGLRVPHREIVVAVGAGQGAAEGQLDGPIQGDPLASQAVLDTFTEIDVTL